MATAEHDRVIRGYRTDARILWERVDKAEAKRDRYRAALERMMRGDHHVGEHFEPEACDCTTNAAREALEGKA